jgi:antitoxin VapB
MKSVNFNPFITVEVYMSQGTVFTSNRTQNVRIPADVRFPDDVKNVTVRAIGKERILTPIENAWDSFFLDGPTVSDDFMDERASQEQSEREAF